MQNQRFFFFLLLIGILAGCGSDDSSTPPPTSTILVAWVQDGDLVVWRSGGEARRIAEGDIVRARLSPDGDQIAFSRCVAMDCAEDELWGIHTDGSEETQFAIQPYLRQLAWINNDTLAFNTLELATIGDFPRDDLTLVNTQTGAHTKLALGGKVNFSPDGEHIVFIDPGTYQAQPARIQVVPVGGNSDPVTRLEYPSVASGAHSPFFPTIHWQDNTTFRVAIPDVDALYYELDGAAPPIIVWQVALEGTTEPIGIVSSSFFGLPQWSVDGAKMVYLQRNSDNPNWFDLWLADGDGANPVLITSQQVDHDMPLPTWIGDSHTILYSQDNAYWLAAVGESPRRWLEGGELLLTTTYQSVGNSLVFIGLRHDTIELRVANLDDDSGQSMLLVESAAGLFFDAMAK